MIADRSRANPNLICYLDAHDIPDGTKIRAVDYILWIDHMGTDFESIYGPGSAFFSEWLHRKCRKGEKVQVKHGY